MTLIPAIGWLWLVALLAAAMLGYDVRRHHFESAGIAFGLGAVVFAAVGGKRWPADPVQSRAPALGLGAVAVLALGAFAWTLWLGPLSDDFVLQRWARSGAWMPESWPHARPLPLALWQLAFAAGGDWPAIHAMNLVIHAINACLVAVLATGWLGSRSGLVAGVTFALFPVSTEAVAWSASIFDVLATFWVLCAVLIWTRWPPSAGQAVALFCCSLAGVLTKETAVAIPLLLALTSLFGPTGPHPEWHRRLGAWAVSAVSVAGYVVWRAAWSPSMAEHLSSLSVDRREWKDLLVRPFEALAVPMRTEAGLPVQAYVAGAAVLVLLAALLLAIRASRAEPDRSVQSSQAAALVIGLGWVSLTALPLLAQFYVSPSLQGGRYLYLPAAGFAVLLSAACVGPMKRTAVSWVAFLALIGVYATVLVGERHVWRQAAATRDAVLTQAAGVVRSNGCRSLDLVDAPDSVHGAFVFRQGLAEALSSLDYDRGGIPCHARWDGAGLRLDIPDAGTR